LIEENADDLPLDDVVPEDEEVEEEETKEEAKGDKKVTKTVEESIIEITKDNIH
jgi:hypothetical protein